MNPLVWIPKARERRLVLKSSGIGVKRHVKAENGIVDAHQLVLARRTGVSQRRYAARGSVEEEREIPTRLSIKVLRAQL